MDVSSIIAQAPGIGALLVVVLAFLRHIGGAAERDREVMRELGAALRELTSELRSGKR